MRRFAPKTSAYKTAMSALFARYISGQMAEHVWEAISRVIDSNNATPEERIAFARYVYDVLEDLGPEALRLPKGKETMDMFALAHVR